MLVHRLKGAGKRGRSSISDLAVKADDIPGVQACFGVTDFPVVQWLRSLSPQEFAEFHDSLKSTKNTPRHVSMIVQRIREFKSLEDWASQASRALGAGCPGRWGRGVPDGRGGWDGVSRTAGAWVS